ncbi:hypothetical protein DF947_01550 [Pedobacter paludis]|uniref:Uncharacterized protein n=1 Tax=Pedobacter paludis TaxID=2203212 RepID=A0A317F5L3_9SPHI|nr:hypothetical protein DF947_01550 [Pedobacter paludis]
MIYIIRYKSIAGELISKPIEHYREVWESPAFFLSVSEKIFAKTNLKSWLSSFGGKQKGVEPTYRN